MNKKKFYRVYYYDLGLDSEKSLIYFINNENAKKFIDNNSRPFPYNYDIEEFTFEDEPVTDCHQLEGE